MVNKIKVLIVDDDQKERDHLTEVINADKDLQVLDAVGDGRKASDIITSQLRPDVVLLDFFLPEADGFSVLERYAGWKMGKKEITFIMMGSSAAGSMIEQAFLLGAAYVLLKPINDTLLLRRLKQISWKGSSKASKVAETPVSEYNSYATVEAAKLELEVSEVLHNLGIPPHVKGYNYLRDAIIFSVYDCDVLGSVTKGLYPVVAQKNGTTTTRVERSIRHAIEISWNRSNLEALQQWFGQISSSKRGKPTNSEFIAMVAERIRLARKRRSLY